MIRKYFSAKQLVGILLFLIGIGLVFLLSWVSSPHLSELSFIPNGVSKWADRQDNDTIRTGVPFFGLGFLLALYLYNKNKFIYWLYGLVFLIIVVVIAELGQYFILSRITDIKDILWGIIGSTIGLVIPFSVFLVKKGFKK